MFRVPSTSDVMFCLFVGSEHLLVLDTSILQDVQPDLSFLFMPAWSGASVAR